jgi:hypothetical protein
MKIIKEEHIKKARKSYYCDGHNQLDRNMDYNDPEHKEAVDQYFNNCKGVIKKGQPYYKQVQREGSELGDLKSCKGCWDVITTLKFYESE